jgi:hypothetical protein
MWGWALLALLLALGTSGLSWLIFPFVANDQYSRYLLGQGCLSQAQWEALSAKQSSQTPALHTAPVASVADELTKLATLKAQGVLTEEEFVQQKTLVLTRRA